MTLPLSSAAQPLPAIATGFVRKLYRMLDQESVAIIAWDRSGKSFSIYDGDKLNDCVLPRYFRGRLFAFRQQLLDHGFQCIANTHGLAVETYAHEFFVRGCPGKLSFIARTPQANRPRRRPSRSKKAKALAEAKRAAAAVNTNTANAAPPTNMNILPPTLLDPVSMKVEATEPTVKPEQLQQNPLFAADDCWDFSQWVASKSPLLLENKISPRGIDEIPDLLLNDNAAAAEMCFSDDTLSTLMNLINTTVSVGPYECIGSSGGSCVPSTMKGSVTNPAGIVETHQFSDDTLNSMMQWIGD